MLSKKSKTFDASMILPIAREETLVSIVVSIVLGLIAQISGQLIPDPFINSIVVGLFLLGILFTLLLPQVFRFVTSHYVGVARRTLRTQGNIIHHLAHLVRDTCVQAMPVCSPYNPPPVTDKKLALPHPSLEQYRTEVVLALDSIAELFQANVPPGTKVWACLRDRRGDDSYHTFARSGFFNPNRAIDSRPMKKDEGTIALLKECCKGGVCVWITGSNKGPAMWKPQENDKYGEDKSVMLGAIMTKSWDAETNQWSNNKLAWVLGVCADTEDAFDETHVPLMRGCVDMLSVLANTLLRYEDGEMQSDVKSGS